MELKNEFMVAAGADETWSLLTNLERVAPCMPGATLQGREGSDYRGDVKVKVGPMSAHFSGVARFLEQDESNHHATIEASGKDQRGQATATAVIRARLESASPTSTRVFVDTELDITGRMAQFGRGAIADVSNRLIKQFTDNLSAEIARGHGPVGRPSLPVASEGQHRTQQNELNLLSIVAPTLFKQGAPLLIGLVLGLLAGRFLPGAKRS